MDSAEILDIPEPSFKTIEIDGRIIKHAEFGSRYDKSSHHIKMWQHNDHSGILIEWHRSVSIVHMGPFNDMMSLVEIHRGEWELYQHINHDGWSVRLSPGAHQLMDYRMDNGEDFNDKLSSFRAV